MEDLTLITCSYETPDVTMTMLKSFRYFHSYLNQMNLVLIENSKQGNDETRELLKENHIKHFVNYGGTHSPSIDIAFQNCKTRYALVVDTDIIFKKDFKEPFEMLKKYNVALAGIECGDRGGYKLHKRIHPWFMFVDLKQIKENGIKFHDDWRIKKTNSEAFFKNVPVNDIKSEVTMYDVGSSFYEDVSNNGLKIANLPKLEDWFIHCEGSSWYKNTDNKFLLKRAEITNRIFEKMRDKFSSVDIKDFYKY
jgi:hypothetical protein